MRRRITVAVLALCALMAIGAPILHAEPKKATPLESKYQSLRSKVVHKHGKRAPGRNIVRDGVRTKHGTRAARKAEIAKSIATFRNILSPPAPPPAPATSGLQSGVSPPASSTSSSAGSTGGGGGGTYCGAYQFDQQTWQSVGGSGSACGASPAEQDRRAQMLYQQRGSKPWPKCGRFAPNWAAVRQCENSGRY